MPLQHIAVIGISGSGKSFLARDVTTKMGLPLFHLGQLVWERE